MAYHHYWSFYRLKDQFKSTKCRLFNQNWSNLIKIGRIWSKIVNFITVFDQIWPIFDKIDFFRYKIEFKVEIWIQIQIQIKIVATIDRTTRIESQKLIKSRFEYYLDQILAGGRSNRISLVSTMLKIALLQLTSNLKHWIISLDLLGWGFLLSGNFNFNQKHIIPKISCFDTLKCIKKSSKFQFAHQNPSYHIILNTLLQCREIYAWTLPIT